MKSVFLWFLFHLCFVCSKKTVSNSDEKNSWFSTVGIYAEIYVGGHYGAELVETDGEISTLSSFISPLSYSPYSPSPTPVTSLNLEREEREERERGEGERGEEKERKKHKTTTPTPTPTPEEYSMSFDHGEWGQLLAKEPLQSLGYVTSAAYFQETQVLVGGNFTQIGGINAQSLAKIFPQNQTVQSLGASVNGPVYAITKISENVSLISGLFTAIDTKPAIGVRYIAQYDISKDMFGQWGFVGVVDLESPPSFIIYSNQSSKVWLLGYYNQTIFECKSPICAQLYIVVGDITPTSIQFRVPGSSLFLFEKASFTCPDLTRLPNGVNCTAAKNLAYQSTVMDIEGAFGVVFLLLMRLGSRNSFDEGVPTLWQYNESNTNWDLVSYNFSSCICTEHGCQFYLNQITTTNHDLIFSGLNGILSYDPQDGQCEELWEEVDTWQSGIVYVPCSNSLAVLGYRDHVRKSPLHILLAPVSPLARLYNFDTRHWEEMPPIPRPIGNEFSTGLVHKTLAGISNYIPGVKVGQPPNCNELENIGVYRFLFGFDEKKGYTPTAQQFGKYKPFSNSKYATGSWKMDVMDLLSNSTIYTTSVNSSESRTPVENIFQVIGGSFSQVGTQECSGLLFCPDSCDKSSKLRLPDSQNERTGGVEGVVGSVFLFPGPPQFGVQTALIEGDDVFIGGQFLVGNTSNPGDLSLRSLIHYSKKTKQWTPIGEFKYGEGSGLSFIFDLYYHCGKLYVSGIFEATLTNGGISKWVVVYDLATETWEGVGPGESGFPLGHLKAPFSVTTDGRYVYLGGIGNPGNAALFYWDSLNSDVDWSPVMTGGAIAFEGIVKVVSPAIPLQDELSPLIPVPCNVTQECPNTTSFCPNAWLYVGGSFSALDYLNFARCVFGTDDNQCRESFCCLSAGVDSPDSTVEDIEIFGNYVFIAGSFTKIGQLFAPGVAVWGGVEWAALPGLQNFQGTVMSISVRILKTPGNGLELAITFGLLCLIAFLFIAALIVIFVYTQIRKKKQFEYYVDLNSYEEGPRPEIQLADLLASQIVVIPWGDLRLGARLGAGSSGEVFRAILVKKFKTRTVAVKMLHFYNRDLENSTFLEDFLYEIVLVSALSHPNLVTFIGVSVDKMTNDVALITELMPRGSLESILEMSRFSLPVKLKLKMAIDVASGLTYLHSLDPPIIHRDMKPENILVATDYTCKISDLGVSTFKRQNERTMTTVGSPVYMAPEIIATRKYTEIADCYSYGVLLCDLFGDFTPYSEPKFVEYDIASLMHAVVNGIRPTIPPHSPELVQCIISECLSDDATLRPSAEEIAARLQRASYSLSARPFSDFEHSSKNQNPPQQRYRRFLSDREDKMGKVSRNRSSRGHTIQNDSSPFFLQNLSENDADSFERMSSAEQLPPLSKSFEE